MQVTHKFHEVLVDGGTVYAGTCTVDYVLYLSAAVSCWAVGFSPH